MSGFILSYPVGDAKSKNTKNYTSLSEMKSDKSIPDGTIGSVSEYGWITMKEAKALEKVVNVPKLKDTGLAEDEIQYIDINHQDFESCSQMIHFMLGLGDPIYLFKSKEGDKVYLWYLETFFSRNRQGIGLKKILANSTPLKKYETILLIGFSMQGLNAMEDGMLEFNNAAAQQKDSKWFTLLFNELLKRKELSLWLDNHDQVYPKSDDLLKEYEEEAKQELIDSGIENAFRVPGLKNSTLYIKENGQWTNICNTHTYEDEETLLSSSAQNGDIAVTNNGTYIRANGKWKDIDSYKKVTWQKLKDLRDGGKLNPGSLYRITDYQCTTTQENTQSAGHQFDIVLLALSENKLAEEGWAIMHEFDTYDITFANNVTLKCTLVPSPESNLYGVGDISADYAVLSEDKYALCSEANFTSIDFVKKTAVISFPSYVLNQNPGYVPYFQTSKLEAWKVWYCLDNDTARFAWADDSVDEGSPASITSSSDSNNILYRDSSKDKTVTFPATFSIYGWTDDDNNTVYTRSTTPNVGDNVLNANGSAQSGVSIASFTSAGEGTGLPNGRGVIYRLIDEFDNDIKYDFKNIQFKRTITNGQYDANGTETWCYTLNVWYEDMCQDASIVGNTLPNEEGFVTGVCDNVFGYTTAYEIYIEGVNTFAFALGNNVVLSFVEDGFYYGISSNTIGDEFYSNTIGNHFRSNIIGNRFYSNTIGNDFFFNTIGNEFARNTIGNYVTHNMIGNYLRESTIGNYFIMNTIGNNFNNNTTEDYIRYIRVEDGVQYTNITTSATTSSSAYLQNIIIGKGVAGTYSSPKTIIHPTVGDTMQTTYVPTNSTTVNV